MADLPRDIRKTTSLLVRELFSAGAIPTGSNRSSQNRDRRGHDTESGNHIIIRQSGVALSQMSRGTAPGAGEGATLYIRG